MLRTFRRSAARGRAGPGTRSPAACTRCCAAWSRAGPPRRSPQLTPPASWQVTPPGAVARARCELAAEFPADLRRLDTQLRESKKKLALVVRASGTTLTGIFGVGPVIAATVIGDVGDVSRFPSRDRFAAYNGTAPVEVSSGGRKIYRLSRRGNRRLNHAIHMAAVTQIRQRHSDGRAYYDKKIAEGKTHKEALRYLARLQRATRGHRRPGHRRRDAVSAPGRPHASIAACGRRRGRLAGRRLGPPVRPRWRGGLACRRC